MSKNHFKCVLSAQSFVCVPFVHGTSRSIDSTTFEMIFGKLVRFLRQFRDTNRYRFVQAVSRNHLITPNKMIFRDTREVNTSQLFDLWAFENKGN